MASQELGKIDQGGTVEISGVELQELERCLLTGDELKIPYVDPEVASRSIAARLVEADDDSFGTMNPGTLGGRDLLDVPLEIIPPYRAMPSQYEGSGPSFYLVFEANRMDTGEHVVVSTGSRNVIATLVNGARNNRFPEQAMKFMEPIDKEGRVKKTRAGFIPLWLVKADFVPEVAEEAVE